MKTLLLLGDSLIEYGAWQDIFPGANCHNFGLAGETVSGLLQRLPAIRQQVASADAIVTMTGTNNLAMDDFYFFQDYENILQQLTGLNPGVEIVVTSLLPVDFPWQPATVINNLNTRLQEMCHRQGLGYQDLHGSFVKALEQRMTVFAEDGIHLSAGGYDIWYAMLLERFPWLK